MARTEAFSTACGWQAQHAAELEGLQAELAGAYAQHARHGAELEALQQQLESAVTRAAQNDEVRLSMVLRHDTLIHV